ncbi:exodeoxyribonuclease VII large subunit [Nitrosomonas ureae]|uniref:Exodeoxyribonuclease 7 large subunit n=1 Tax=Nitrosomonas ureae TaxID=44577 RepID=A0A0S3AIJ3_9PROT|nr:exodeoxyribonuclease VII large subunit [Nitrosomonas ureae]ALQ50958.1 exodeoxyribonuclease VII large subunit [Nitrosomonas ureae]SDT85140.1 Exodeoxyribonuclease VII large subunit [Nitrosomonas ureae]SEQ23805.1 Exodeoxyribonuclease VII large subunit [Nitrosomonas ureae]
MNLFSPNNPVHKALTVSELNNNTKQLLEHNIPLLWIKGEISNLKRYQSGHWYFSLKDNQAQVRCVLFSHKNQFIDWHPIDGMQVEVLALVTLYEPRGDFQLNVETMRRAGLGELFAAFETLKSKLQQAGLFNSEKKKPLPVFPQQIGIITSLDTAALQDILSTLQRRMPSLSVIIYPTLVQGKTAANNIAEAIKTACQRTECDVLILCRGGGSIEDLWAFNEETVAHAIDACSIPLISGIGHETDFTIADFVADMRAPTPTAAAEMASKDRIELSHRLNVLHQRMCRTTLHRIERAMQQVDILSHRLIYPGDKIRQQVIHQQHLQDRLIKTWAYQLEKRQWKLLDFNQRLMTERPQVVRLQEQHDELVSRLCYAYSRYSEILFSRLKHLQIQLLHLNPQSILDRGYSIAHSKDGTIIRSSKQIHSGDRIKVKFAQGMCKADVSVIRDSDP